MTTPFRFETEIDEGLGFMPLALRYRLDRAGLKVSLAAWRALPYEARRRLFDAPASGDEDVEAFARATRLALDEAGHAAAELPRPASPPPWREAPARDGAAAWASELGLAFDGARWAALDDVRAYALYRLSASRKNPAAFRAALDDFGLSGAG